MPPHEGKAVLDKITFGAFKGTPLAIMLRDCGLTPLVICGLVPVVLRDACGAGHRQAGERSIESLAFVCYAIISDVEEFVRAIGSNEAHSV
jgi:nicotinamidase-related amidase